MENLDEIILAILSKMESEDFNDLSLEMLKQGDDQTQQFYLALTSILKRLQSFKEGEARYKSVIETAVDAIIVIDKTGIVQSCNHATTRLLGYSEAEIIGNNVNMLMPEKIASEHDQYILNYLHTGINKVIGKGREVQGKKKNGTLIDLFLSVSKMEINGEIYFTGLLHDISQEIRIKNNLALSEAKSKAILKTAVDAIIVINEYGIVQSVNPATEKLFGYSSKLLINQNISILMPEPTRTEHDQYLRNYLSTGKKKVIGIGREVTALRKDGSQFYAYLSVSEFSLAGERLFTGIVRDITIQKEQEIELAKSNQKLKIQNQQKESINQFHLVMKGEQSLVSICKHAFKYYAKNFGLMIGACYLIMENKIELIEHFSFDRQQYEIRKEFSMSEGLIGSVIQQGEVFVCNNDQNLLVDIGFGKLKPAEYILMPIKHLDSVIGLLEVGFKEKLSDQANKIFSETISILGISLENAKSRDQLTKLLQKTLYQEEQLRSANDELSEQTKALRSSEENTRLKSEELEVVNSELQEKMSMVEKQSLEIEKQKAAIEKTALKLSQASQYKSEFLANMSHELRTPLNSLLLLSSGLLKNPDNNLTSSQIEDVEFIEASGKTLLNLICDILDLSKVESGKLEITVEPISFGTIIENLMQLFNPVSQEKGLEFTIENHINGKNSFASDPMRVEQILRNLLSNAFKFTKKGKVTLILDEVSDPIQKNISRLKFSVMDTGVGIAAEKQVDIFQAFQQADGGISREYGGTGLGLTICDKLAKLLGGEVKLERSEIKNGSTFSLALPWDLEVVNSTGHVTTTSFNAKLQHEKLNEKRSIQQKITAQAIEDDRHEIMRDTKSVLIIEDDLIFLKGLSKIAHEEHFKCIISTTGEAAIALAKQYQPTAIMLDLGLPDISGEKVLAKLKNDLSTRHIPVHVITAHESNHSLQQNGVIQVLIKPVEEKTLHGLFENISKSLKHDVKKVLIVEDDEITQHAIKKLIAYDAVQIDGVLNGNQALISILGNSYDCVILDYNLPDMNAIQLLNSLVENGQTEIPPIIIYTGAELTQQQFNELNKYTSHFVIKGADSYEHLLDEVTLFLHSLESELYDKQKLILQKIHTNPNRKGKISVMIVDDDLRNSFALSKRLRGEGIEVLVADNGKLALERLVELDNLDLILMDIMMPEIDGYETIARIRENMRWKTIPIIALTAKAMSDDKQKCLDAGANDYLAKPIDFDKLLKLMGLWITI